MRRSLLFLQHLSDELLDLHVLAAAVFAHGMAELAGVLRIGPAHCATRWIHLQPTQKSARARERRAVIYPSFDDALK